MVVAAFLLLGFLKAVMPFEMASMPVSAVQPLLNARRIKKRPRVCAVVWTISTPSTGVSVPVAILKKPMPSVSIVMTRKK